MIDVKLDLSRAQRLGFDEAIFCAGKNVAQIEHILDHADRHGGRFLLTRLSGEKAESLMVRHRDRLDFDPVSQTAFFGPAPNPTGEPRIAILCAGTSDVPVAREAARTLRYYGQPALEIYDVGVAGLWRLTERLEEIRAMRIVIVAAGMDAALVSVLGGLISSVVIALPTSVGYGVAAGGASALNASLASCAPGVLVVNIDNGYGAACGALRALRALSA
jgi:pyridinium-3,5-biscarboxylic acid mononucleotide synthase